MTIKWTPEGKVIGSREDLANALDEAVALVRKHFNRHDECDDAFYSCPKAAEYCGETPGEYCSCGKDEADALLRKLGIEP